MKLEIQNRDDHQVQLTAEVEAEILSQYLQRAARQIARESKIPGFRPGKAPYDIVQRLYGEEFIQKQALDLLIDDTYPKVIEDAKIDPSGPGTLEKIISVNPPIFSFIIPLAPEVELGDYRSIRLEYEPKPTTDNDVDQILLRLQRRSATAEPVERAAQLGDLVYMKLSASFAESAAGENAVLFEETPYQAVVGEEHPGEVEWPFPGFSQQLAGLAANDEKTVPYTYPEDSTYDRLANKTVLYKVIVQSLKSLTLPELNDEFANLTGEFETLDDLKNIIRANLEQTEKQDYDEHYFDRLIDQITAGATIKYPPHLLDEEIEEYLKNIEKSLAERKMDLTTYLKTRELDREKYIDLEARPASIRQLERTLVLKELSRAEDIKVDDSELREAVTQRLNQMGNSLDNKHLRSEKALRNLTDALTHDTLNRIFYTNLMERLKLIATGMADTLNLQESASAESTVSVEPETAKSEEIAGTAG